MDSDLALRLAAVERALRRQRALAGLALAALLLGLTAPASRPAADPVRAGEFQLVDGAGVVRGSFTLESGLHPSLALLDEQGRKRWQVLLKDDEVFSYMRDREGRGRITHAVDRANNPHFLVHDRGNKPRIHAAVAESGAPSLVFIHVDGTMPAGVGVHADGRGWVLPDPAKAQTKGTAGGEDAKK